MGAENRKQRDLDYLLYDKLVNGKENKNCPVTQKGDNKPKKEYLTQESTEGVSCFGRPIKHWKMWGIIAWIIDIIIILVVLFG